jgi:glycosyltransferase involved in cell wall biosynthesis
MKGVMAPFQPARTTVVMLTYNPSGGGYFEDRPAVTKLSIASLLAHTDGEYDLMVFDNGSSPEMVEYLSDLKQRGLIQYLILSERNVGYGAALNIAFSAAPGSVIAYTDDDVFFYPGWLEKQTEILETFPEVGIVSGQLVQGDMIHDAVVGVADKFGFKIEDFDVPESWTDRWCTSMNIDTEEFLSRPEVKAIKNYKVEYKGVEAFAGGTGYSFTFTKKFLTEMPGFLSDRVIGGEDAAWHRTANEMGRLRLTTCDLTTDHIGNVLDSRWIDEAKAFNLNVDGLAVSPNSARRTRTPLFLRHRYARRIAKWMARKLVESM